MITKFYKNKWYMGLKTNPRYKDYIEIWQGKPYSKYDYKWIKEFPNIPMHLMVYPFNKWRRASRVVYEPIENLIIGGTPVEKLIGEIK